MSRARSRLLALGFGIALPCLLFAAAEWALARWSPPPSVLLRVETATGTLLSREAGLLRDGGLEANADRIAFAPEKAAGTTRVLVVGESTAAGFPLYPFLSFGRVMETRLREAGAERVEVVNLGKAADPSSVVRDVAREALQYEVDLLVVYCGHNDFQWPYGEELRTEPGWLDWVGRSHVARWLRGTPRVEAPSLEGGSHAPQPPEGWLIADTPAVHGALRQRGVARYRGHVEQMLEAAAEHEVPVILVTQASNLRDFAPNYSFSELPEAERRQADAALRRLRDELAASTTAAEARAKVEQLDAVLARDPGIALAHWLRGRWLERAGALELAGPALRRARDLDGYPSRAIGAFNDVLRELAEGSEGVHLVDAAADFASRSHHGAPGEDLFLDHCHPNVEATFQLGELILAEVVRLGRDRLGFGAALGAELGLGKDFLQAEPVEPWLERMGLSRAFLATRAAGAGTSVLLSYLQSPSSREPLRLALLSFEEALEVDPANPRALAGSCAVHILLGNRAEALARAQILSGIQSPEAAALEMIGASPTFQQALHQLDLELVNGLPRALENHP